MSTNTTVSAATASHAPGQQADRGPAFVAYSILRYGFIALPLLMGLDKFFNVLTDWPGYLAPWIADLSPMSPQVTMYVVGVIEIVAAVAMVIKPRYASYVVALWLALIIIDLLSLSGYYDVALRDFGLLLAALALARLASVYDTAWPAKR
jgi:uncharacterized membrane protein YphA (DoxX/SURF4 family)